MQRILGIGRHVLRHVGRDRAAGQDHHGQHDHAKVPARQHDVVRALDACDSALAVRDRFRQRAAHPYAERQAHRPEQERDAPSIRLEHVRRHRAAQDDTDEGADGRCDLLAGGLPCHHQAAIPGCRDLDEIGRGRSDFAAEREPLHHPRQDHDDRRHDADRGIGRRQRDGQDRSTHQRKAQQHRRPPADPIGEDAEHDAADRPCQEAGTEGRKRQHEAAVFAMRGEEGAADLGRKEAVGDEVVELQHVADGRGKGGALDIELFPARNVRQRSRFPRLSGASIIPRAMQGKAWRTARSCIRGRAWAARVHRTGGMIARRMSLFQRCRAPSNAAKS
ncbi:hypothetical protein ACVWY2_004862 [Bradyrhizobium sp. JR6.1]